MFLACKLASRMRGLLFREGFEGEMLICPCNSVHTFGMGERIDIAFVDSRGMVLEVFLGVEPSRLRRRRGACAVIERVSLADRPWYQVGDRLGLAVVGLDGKKGAPYEDVSRMRS